MEAIAKGERFSHLVQRLADEWGVSPKTSELYVCDTIAFMRSDSTKDALIAMNMERLDSIISDSINDGDRRNAIKAIDTQNKLAGGYTEKVKIEGNSEINLVFDIGETNEDSGTEETDE